MAGCGATGEQHIVLGKRIFYSALFSVEELNEIGEYNNNQWCSVVYRILDQRR